jgi:hypothetical protein
MERSWRSISYSEEGLPASAACLDIRERARFGPRETGAGKPSKPLRRGAQPNAVRATCSDNY